MHGSNPERTLTAITKALKPNGHLMMTEVVAEAPLDPADPVVAGWAPFFLKRTLIRKSVPAEQTITRVLGSLGFDVRVVEDISQRQIHQALLGWRTTVNTMENAPPAPRQAMCCVEEAELWLLRLRLFQVGSLRLVRWHAIGGG